MPCYKPLVAYRSKDVNASGKRSMVFNPTQALAPDDPKKLPCGQCIGCRLRYSAQWAARCWHESQMHDDNCFLTLTFSDKYLPEDGSIHVRDCQLFMKRLRKKIFPRKARMAYCGEYGEKFRRPHYHFLVFGYDFEDKYLWCVKNGQRLYRSPTLETLWPFGNSLIGSVTFDSAAYVARYMLKKQKGPESSLKYMDLDISTGEIFAERSKEFFHTSRRPGIGREWFRKHWRDVFPSDEVRIDGKRMLPPRFYDTQFEILDPMWMDEIRGERELNALRFVENCTPERLSVREKVKLAQIRELERGYENGTESI